MFLFQPGGQHITAIIYGHLEEQGTRVQPIIIVSETVTNWPFYTADALSVLSNLGKKIVCMHGYASLA